MKLAAIFILACFIFMLFSLHGVYVWHTESHECNTLHTFVQNIVEQVIRQWC